MNAMRSTSSRTTQRESSSPRRSIPLRTKVLALGGLALLVACTSVVSEDAVQCSSDADCLARGPDFVDSVCNPTGLCEAKAPTAVTEAPPECTKTSDCSSKGANLVCSPIHKKCAPLPLSDGECSVAYGDPMADGAVLFGLLSEIGHDDTLYFRQQQHLTAARLAFQEFFDKAGVVFPGNRKAALIACSEHYSRRVSAQLANIGVRAVIGPSSEERQKPVVETLIKARVPSFSPWINGNPSSVIPEATGFAWLAGFRRADVVAPLNALMAEQEAKLKADSAGAITSVRVAVIINTPSSSSFNAFAEYGDLMDQRLIFNGKSAVENQRDAACNNCYQRFETSQAALNVVAKRAQDIVAFNPHFIVPFADIDWGAQLLPKLEELYAAAPVTTNRPIYLQTFLQIEDAGYKSLNTADAAVRKRVTGIRPIRDNSFEVFQNKFREAVRPVSDPSKLGPDPNPGAGRAFETALLLLMSTYSALQDKADAAPEDVVAALKTVTDPAAATKVTLNDIQIGIAALNKKEHVKLSGLFTTFDFDGTTYSAPPTWTTWCLGDKGQYVSGARVFKDGSFGAPVFCP